MPGWIYSFFHVYTFILFVQVKLHKKYVSYKGFLLNIQKEWFINFKA